MIRCNDGAEMVEKLVLYFGGGGHGYAAGFKIHDGRSFDAVKQECIIKTTELLDSLVR
mgnify:CR=1 FL=1